MRQDAENAVPLLTDTNIFRTTTPQNSVLGALAALPGNPMVPCLTNPATSLPAQTCAFALSTILTVDATPDPPFRSTGQAMLNNYLINQLIDNGGLFNYNTNDYLFNGRHRPHFR